VNTDKIIDMRTCPYIENQHGGLSGVSAPNPAVFTYAQNVPNLLRNGQYQAMQPNPSGTASYFYRVDIAPHPAEFLVLLDTNGKAYHVTQASMKGALEDSPGMPSIQGRHLGGVNILRADWHVDFVQIPDVDAQVDVTADQNTWFMGD